MSSCAHKVQAGRDQVEVAISSPCSAGVEDVPASSPASHHCHTKASASTDQARCPLSRAFMRALHHLVLSPLARCFSSVKRGASPKPLGSMQQTSASSPNIASGLLRQRRLRNNINNLPDQASVAAHEQQLINVAKLRLKAGVYVILYTHAKRQSELVVSQLTKKLQMKDIRIKELATLELQHRTEIDAISRKMMLCDQDCEALRGRLEAMESLHDKESMIHSGSYQDSAPTPPLLQCSVDAVKEAITICASDLLSLAKKCSATAHFLCIPGLPQYTEAAGVSSCTLQIKSRSSTHVVKTVLQAFLSQILFEGFQEPSWSHVPGKSSQEAEAEIFEKPQQRKDRHFQEYLQWRYVEVEKLLDANNEFKRFYMGKLCCAEERIIKLLQSDSVTLQVREEATSNLYSSANVTNSNNSTTSFIGSFLRLAKAVWLLQKLAFAFQPSAEMFRVSQGSEFDDEFMDNMAKPLIMNADSGSDSPAAMSKESAPARRVRFMCVPGFAVRHTIIKSSVFLHKPSAQYSDHLVDGRIELDQPPIV